MIDLLDARGYHTEFRVSSDSPVKIKYLGAVKAEHSGLTYDEDPYVVSRVEEKEFVKNYSVVLKDSGIRKSGLKIHLEAGSGTEIRVYVCGEELCILTAEDDSGIEEILDLNGLCKREREYLDNIHRILYILLAEVDRICTKYGLHYFLVFGGLLGVVRYGDIVPWDDDIDIAMTREDFQKFKEVALKELGPDFMYLDCSEMGGGAFLDFMCRVMYMKEEVPVNVFRKVSGKCRKDVENHLPMDIFILDKASDSPRMHKIHMLMIRGVYGLGMGHRAYLNKEEYSGRDRMTRISVCLLSAIGKLLPLKLIMWLHDQISMIHQGKETKDYFMSNGYLPFIHTRYKREWFETNSVRKLGDMDVSVPADVEAYLKRAYYDYYHYPPVNKRVPEHSPDSDGVI